MKKENKIDLKKILESTNADAILLADNEGNIKNSYNVEYETNIALMTETMFTMCKDLSKDLGNGDLDQIMAKSSKGFFVVNKLDPNSILIAISKDNSKIGLLLKFISSLTVK